MIVKVFAVVQYVNVLLQEGEDQKDLIVLINGVLTLADPCLRTVVTLLKLEGL